MRRLPRKPLNPGYTPPKVYLAGGLTEGPNSAPRAALLSEYAAGLGRQLLLEDVPLTAHAQLSKELEAGTRLATDPAALRQRLGELAGRSATTRYPLLAQVLTAAIGQVRRIEDARALVAHLKRAYALANFSRVLGGATAIERERAERRTQVRKHRLKG